MVTIKGAVAAAAGSALLLVLAGHALPRNLQASQTAAAAGNSAAMTKADAIEMLRNSPMSFEANQGQTDQRVRFTSRGPGYALFLTGDSAVMTLESAGAARPAQKPAHSASLMAHVGDNASASAGESRSTAVLNMHLVGANAHASVSAIDQLPSASNYFIGNDPAKWRTSVPSYEKVRYSAIYPGIDLVYYGNQQQLEYDFVVAPGADPSAIALHFGGEADGSHHLASSIDGNGDLMVHLASGDVRFHQPVVYQKHGSEKTLVASRYQVGDNGQITFALGSYDRSRELVIDPTISYSTFLGGNNVDVAMGVALDRFGSCFITGSTLSSDFPLMNPLQTASAGGKDIFITKFNSKASAPEYSTYVGGSGDDVATDIHIDSLGDMTVTGYTLSTNFPLVKAIQATFGGGTVTGDAFVFQIASHGTAMVFSTYLGGSSDDQGFSLAIDGSNNVYVVGYTSSINFPVSPNAFKKTCGDTSGGSCSNGFVIKLPSKGNVFTYSSYLGGSGGLGDAVYGVVPDSSGNAYVVGITGSPNFPTTAGAYKTTCGSDSLCNGTYDGFVSEVNSAGTGLVFSTFLGGSSYDYAAGVAIDTTGIYVSGNTTSTDFPVTAGAAQTKFGGMSAGCVPSSSVTCGDVTISKLNPTGSALLYATYLGGSLDENPGFSMAVDAGGSAYITGQTDSLNFPLVTPVQPSYGGGASDAFITKLNPTGSAFSYSTYIGGADQDSGSRIAIDAFTAAYVSGTTVSPNFPVTTGVFQTKCGTDGACNGGLSDAFAVKVTTSAVLQLSVTAPTTVASGSQLTYTIVDANNGPDTASVVSITDPLPAGTTFQSVAATVATCTGPVVGGTGTVTCTIGSQAKNSRNKITLVVNVTAGSGTVISNTVSVIAANSKKVSKTANTTVN